MSELAPLPRDQRKIDAGHLKTLAVFHFVGAGLAVLGILLLCVHYAVFHTIFTDPKFWQGQNQPALPPELFSMLHLLITPEYLSRYRPPPRPSPHFAEFPLIVQLLIDGEPLTHEMPPPAKAATFLLTMQFTIVGEDPSQ